MAQCQVDVVSRPRRPKGIKKPRGGGEPLGLAMAVGGMNESVVLGAGERGKGVGWSDSVDAVQSSSLASKFSSYPCKQPSELCS